MTKQQAAERIATAELTANEAGRALQAHLRQYGIGGSPVLQEALGAEYQKQLRALKTARLNG
jgi:UDP-N-acetyl-D-mannosaminuronic acid transferase (WecB/TagA/CpsF family)